MSNTQVAIDAVKQLFKADEEIALLKAQRDELLEALENWINALDEPSAWMECRDNAKKAIAKAKGE